MTKCIQLADLNHLVKRLQKRPRLLVFTGAGVSTGSGIPDFRGPDGLWTKSTPVYFKDFLLSHEERVRHWTYKLEGWDSFRHARPNRAHQALAQLDHQGRLHTLVTQNIDGLHQLAGHSNERIIELHGTNRLVQCVSCLRSVKPDPIFAEFSRTRKPPRCPCGGFLKPATVSFGQAMPQEKIERALTAASQAQVVCSIGSTLEVEPAASVPRTASQCGAFYVVINRGPTAHDQIADLRIEGDVNILLPELTSVLDKGTGR